MLNKILYVQNDMIFELSDGRLGESLADNTSVTCVGYWINNALCVVSSG